MEINEQTVMELERVAGVPRGKGVPPKLLEAYRQARAAADRLQHPAFTPLDLVLIALVAGVLPTSAKKEEPVAKAG